MGGWGKQWRTSKYVLTKIDNLRCFAYTSPCEVEKPIKNIRMPIMKSNPGYKHVQGKEQKFIKLLTLEEGRVGGS
jgi:hypothetical protein